MWNPNRPPNFTSEKIVTNSPVRLSLGKDRAETENAERMEVLQAIAYDCYDRAIGEIGKGPGDRFQCGVGRGAGVGRDLGDGVTL
jgi:hypothetical protein